MRTRVLWILALLVVGVGGFWAGGQVVSPSSHQALERPTTPTYVAEAGSLGNVLSFTGSLQWQPVGTATSPGEGVLTAVEVAENGLIEAGDVLYRVDEDPVVACPGKVPAYRDLVLGDRGRDVAQLRACFGLKEAGEFDDKLVEAVQKSQRGVGRDGGATVPLGSIVFIAELPARGYFEEGISVGTTLTPGQPVMTTVGSAPEVLLTVSSTAPVVPSEGMTVTGEVSGETFTGVLGPGSTDENGETVLPVRAPDGSPVCRDRCASAATVPGPVDVPMRVEVVAPASGVLVPVSAIRTLPDGTAQVTTPDKSNVTVSVLTSVGGQAVVTGLEPGTEIVLFAPAQP